MEKIGLQAIFETKEFIQGMNIYIKSVRSSETITDALADDLTRLGGDFDNLGGSVASMAARMRASTPENVRFAQTFDKINKEFQEGKITSQQAATALEKLQTEMNQTGTATTKASGGLKMFWTELSSGLNVAKMAIQSVVQAGKQVLALANDTAEYAKQVRDLGRSIGEGAEESSKLIQVADDVMVSYETLERGLIAAVRKGINPNVESIGKLSDEYRKLEPGLERTKFLTDRFGRAGAEMAPLMELGSDAIKRMGEEAVKTGLVMSDKAVRAAREYEIALDNLEDTVGGLKVSIGMGLIPILTKLLDTWNDAIVLQKVMNQAIDVGAAKSLAGLNAELGRTIRAGGTTKEFIEKLTLAIEQTDEAIEAARIDKYTAELNRMHTSVKGLAKQMEEERLVITAEVLATLELAETTAILTRAKEEGLITEKEYAVQTALLEAGLWDLTEVEKEAYLASFALTDAQKALIVQEKELEAQSIKTWEQIERLQIATAQADKDARAAAGGFWDLAAAMKGAGEAEIAIQMIDNLRKMYDKGLISVEALNAGERALGLEFGIVDLAGIGLAELFTGPFDRAIRSGIVNTEDLVGILDEVKLAAEDGTFTFEDLVDILETTGTVSHDAAVKMVDASLWINDIDLGEGIKQTGAMATNLTIIAGAPAYKKFQYDVITTYTNIGGGGDVTKGWNPYMAEGGSVSGGQPVITGDAGRAEVFVPGSDGYIFPSIGEFKKAFSGSTSSRTNNFNLNMNTQNANMQTVRQSFEMMRLLNGN